MSGLVFDNDRLAGNAAAFISGITWALDLIATEQNQFCASAIIIITDTTNEHFTSQN